MRCTKFIYFKYYNREREKKGLVIQKIFLWINSSLSNRCQTYTKWTLILQILTHIAKKRMQFIQIYKMLWWFTIKFNKYTQIIRSIVLHTYLKVSFIILNKYILKRRSRRKPWKMQICTSHVELCCTTIVFFGLCAHIILDMSAFTCHIYLR